MFLEMRQISYSDLTIRDAINLLTTGKMPFDMPRMTRFRFRNRFLSGHYSVKDRKLLYDGRKVIPDTKKAVRPLRFVFSRRNFEKRSAFILGSGSTKVGRNYKTSKKLCFLPNS